jgi:alpha-ketoglutarate-dependent taurine dioxygenase
MTRSTNFRQQFGAVKRQAIGVSQESLVTVKPLLPDRSFPTCIEPTVPGVNLLTWATQNQALIETQLLQQGGILFRNFQTNGIPEFQQFIQATSKELMQYTYCSSPRTQVQGDVYTSTEHPADQTICMHNEMSYFRDWPMKIWFYCTIPAAEGGQTPIADSREFTKRLNPTIQEEFKRKQVMYVRNFQEGIDIPWQVAFHTRDKAEAEDYCRQAGIEFEWVKSNHLRTWQVCQSHAVHPQTGDEVWFNQADLFHVSRMEPETRKSLLSVFAEADLPRNTYYGDGSPIPDEVIAEIIATHQQEAVVFPWQAGDVVMLDNMLASHGRKPFVGPRKVVVGMAEAFSAVSRQP